MIAEYIDLEIEIEDVELEIEFDTSGVYDYYEGPYDVIPLAWDDQILETREKIMRRNVHVEKIPYYETTNPSGKTVYIGE